MNKMADEKKSITLYVAQQPFKLSVLANQEELYHKAEKKIQEYIRNLSENNKIHDKVTQLGYAAIYFAINEMRLTEKQQFVNTDLKDSLKKIKTIIQEVLDEPN